MKKVEYDENMLEEDKINRFLNILALEYDGGLARDFEQYYIKKCKEVKKMEQKIEKALEYCDNNLEFTPRRKDVINILTGEKNE